MEEWLKTGIHQVNAFTAAGPDFQRLMKQTDTARIRYAAAVQGLSPVQRQAIEDYIALCEELEYQKTVTAYYCGGRNG